MTKFKKFKVYAPPDCKTYGLNEDGTLTITGIASTTNEDLDGEIISADALKSLARQVKNLNLHLDHNHSYDGGIGTITDAELERNYLKITAIILPEYAKGVLKRLELGMNFGFSIGGIPVINQRNSRLIDDFKLLEVSLTLLPANWDTFGTVEIKQTVESKCFSQACNYIIKNKGGKMTKKDLDGTPKVSADVKNELVNIVNEAVYNLTPILLDKIRGEVNNIVQEVVSTTLVELLPAEEQIPEPVEEIPEEELLLEEEELEEFAEEEETVEDKEAEEEEIFVEEEELPEGEGLLDEEILEDEKEVTDDPIDGIEATGDEVEYAGDEEELETPAVDTKHIAQEVVKEVRAELFKKLQNSRRSKKSKLNQYKKSQTKKTSKKSKFLDNDKRDKYGRNKKYL